MTRGTLIALAGLGSAAMLLAAFGFQYLGGLAPCAMCLWQRWPHAAAMVLGAVGLALPHVALAALGALSMAVNAGIALTHTGVERGWWVLNLSCTSGSEDLGAMSAADLLNPEIGTGIVMCDEVAWQMFGLSMASWNGIASLVLMAIWIAAARARATA
ncbi:disulfide bond formation protein B [Roseicyclus amphidinii]|uniref:disulfide bond formation protein B n=1 Tax=Roseicyclus amphidinii TaxID=3034232 RepID=UPI0024E0DE30|nr:disulfide bond formation protein B [Roseicyclus sp. Amp-Y-6]